MGRAREYLQRLSRFPHRGSGTPAEAGAARAIAEWLTFMSYTPETEPFLTPRDTLYLGPATVAALFVLAGTAGLFFPGFGLFLCAVGLVPLLGEMLGSSRVDFDILLPRYPSQNVTARLAPVGERRRTLVVSGHYDTQRASWLFHPRVAPFLPLYFYTVYTSLLLVPVGLAVRLALPGRTWTAPLLLAAAGLVALHLLFLLLCRLTGRYINGANDNGTGVALALALAEQLARSPLSQTEVIFLFTGAEEVGLRGMKAFLRTCRLDPATTRFINLDNIGGGRLHYLTGEGMLAVRPYGPSLLRLAGEMAAGQPDRVRRRGNLLLPTDGLVPAMAGYEAISFLTFLEDGSLAHYHWYTDTLDAVDLELLDFAESFLAEYLHRVARLTLRG